MAEQILHFGALTFRINGIGQFRMSLINYDRTMTETLVPFTMSLIPGKEPTRLTNFVQQRALLRVETTDIDEYFKINRHIYFVKPIYSQYPGTE